MASATCQHRHTLVANSDGVLAGDILPMVRLNVQVIAVSGGDREVGYQGMGGRYDFERLLAGATLPKCSEFGSAIIAHL